MISGLLVQTTDNSYYIITSFVAKKVRNNDFLFVFVLVLVFSWNHFHEILVVVGNYYFFTWNWQSSLFWFFSSSKYSMMMKILPSQFALLTSCDDCLFWFQNFVKLIYYLISRVFFRFSFFFLNSKIWSSNILGKKYIGNHGIVVFCDEYVVIIL